MENQVFNYNGTNITFQLGNGDVMVNLTEVAKAFPSKNLSTIVNSKEVKEYISKMVAIKNFIATDLLRVENGIGTWAHQKVALRVVQKLSPEFAIWVDERIEELLKNGVTTVSNDDEAIMYAMNVLQKRLDVSKQRVEMLEGRVELQSAEIKKQAPKVEYHDEVLTSTSTYNTKHIAKELGMSAIALNRTLHSLGVQYKHRGTWLLYSKYQDKEYTKTETHSFTNSKGETQTSMQTVWTEKGRKFIHKLLKQQNVA